MSILADRDGPIKAAPRRNGERFGYCGVTFECWATTDGRYRWRTSCGRGYAGRTGKTYTAACDRKTLGIVYPTLKTAMVAVVAALTIAGRAAA